MKPRVAIVGRANVGKSTLFNRLVGRRLALVADTVGVTRDRNYADAECDGRSFTLIDTGGFADERDHLHDRVKEQAQAAIDEADPIILVVDGRSGPTSSDLDLATDLRKRGKSVLVAVNKIDTQAHIPSVADFYRMGLKEVFPISAEHGLGLTDFLDRLCELLPPPSAPTVVAPESPAVRIAIVGRPNVGKSTLVNALLGEERLVASVLPGTTRDAIDSRLSFQGRDFILTDTAGIRHKQGGALRIEEFAVIASHKAIQRSDVVALVMDATEPAVDQDARIASLAEESGRALLLVLNKSDQLPSTMSQKELRTEVKYQLKFVSYAPSLFISALKGLKIHKIFEAAAMLHDELNFRAPTPAINRLLQDLMDSHPPPIASGRAVRCYYIAQVGTAPPTFALTCNYPELMPERYKRYIINQLRRRFSLRVPIRLIFRGRPKKRAGRGVRRRD
ncbi:MAG TPA: ribosome biogenesis GTPase Der [Myxococcaceae bacterium]|nr:ribosome biogenesis GTPase Der [Myxococcaceae bacterium]